MALQLNLESTQFGISAPQAYLKIASYVGTKDQIQVQVAIYFNKDARQNDMTMYVVGDGSTPTSRAADPAKARLYEDYYFRDTRKADVTGKTGEQVQRIIVNTWAVDGEIFALKVNDPATGKATMQLIEGHRVVNPSAPKDVTPDTWDGFVFGKYGEVRGIWVQFGEGQFEFKPAGTYLHIADFKRVSGAHGLPPMAQALNSMQDQPQRSRLVASHLAPQPPSRTLGLVPPPSLTSR